MPATAFEPIHPNPYIVGNPIRGRQMFFGRLDEFHFIDRTLEHGQKTSLIVLYGDRRSGKTSILYQILNGQLGEVYLPVFVDVQLMAGVDSEMDFFARIIAGVCGRLGNGKLRATSYATALTETTPTEVFRQFLQDLRQAYSDQAILFLIDEYELLEDKIAEGSLPAHLPAFFAGLLESEQISFIFAGSKRLESRDQSLWGMALLQKATARKVSFLTREDTARLITQPLADKVKFSPEVIAGIYKLTAGQPFYTQLICQYLVFHLNEVKHCEVTAAELESVVENIIDNPPPQLIFNWGEHRPERKLTLSLFAEFSESSGSYLSAGDLRRGISRHKLKLDLGKDLLNSELSALYQDEYLLRRDGSYCFRLDLYRRWLRRDHDIWQVKKEIGPRELVRITKPTRVKKERRQKRFRRLEHSFLIGMAVAAVSLAAWLFLVEWQKRVTVIANGGPFEVIVDGLSFGNNRGDRDSTQFRLTKTLTKGYHEFAIIPLATGDSVHGAFNITKDDQVVDFSLPMHPVTVTSDAASMICELGGLRAETVNDSNSWHHTFRVAAGTYPVKVTDPQTQEEAIATIIVTNQAESLHVDFEQVVVVHLNARVQPYRMQFSRANPKNLKNRAESLTITSQFQTLRGWRKGFYHFEFFNPATGQSAEDTLTVVSDMVVPVPLEPKWRPTTRTVPPETTVVVLGPEPQKIPEVHISSTPAGANLFVDEIKKGTTTMILKLAQGSHVIRLEMPWYDPVTFILPVRRDTIVPLIKLKRQLGYLKVLVNEEGTGMQLSNAEIFVDGESWGEANRVGSNFRELPAGHHRVEIRLPDYRHFKDERVTIYKGERKTLPVKLVKFE